MPNTEMERMLIEKLNCLKIIFLCLVEKFKVTMLPIIY